MKFNENCSQLIVQFENALPDNSLITKMSLLILNHESNVFCQINIFRKKHYFTKDDSFNSKRLILATPIHKD